MARRVEIHCFSRAGYGLEATTGTWSRFPRTVDAAKTRAVRCLPRMLTLP